ncbi:MAG: zinc-binding dehydrogenase [bacterium]
MKAAVLHQNNNFLTIEEVELPLINDDEILVKVIACGVCHTDLHYIDHGVDTFQSKPVILGHEISGIVEDSKSEYFEIGDKVLLPAVYTCGECSFCLKGRENLCKNFTMLGNSINGGFAEYIKVKAKDSIKLPDSMLLEESCIIADAVSTPYYAVVHRAKVAKYENVLIVGCGGVGINAVQIASMLGANVIACDINDNKLKIAKELGAKHTVNLAKDDLKTFLKDNKITINKAFEIIGQPKTIELAYKMLGVGGKLCIIGYTNQNININPAKIMFYEQEIIGSCGCPPRIYPEIIELVEKGKLNLSKVINNKYSLDAVNKAFDELRSGKILRNIILPNSKI